MEVAFYGLSNNATDNQNIYYAVLYVEDSVGNNLILTVRLIVDPTSGGNAGIPFNAEFDCQTHSMLLTYQDNALIYPSYDNVESKDYAEAYIIQNNAVLRKTLPSINDSSEGVTWDYSVNYGLYGEDGVVNITGVDGDDGVRIPNIYKGSENEEQFLPEISYTEATGLLYKHFFSDNQLSINKDSHFLELLGDEGTISTELIPSGSFVGDIFNINCEGEYDYQNIDLQYKIPDPFFNFDYYNNSLKDIDAPSNI